MQKYDEHIAYRRAALDDPSAHHRNVVGGKCYRQRPPQGKYPPRGRCGNGPRGIVVRADPQIAACAA